MDQDNEKKSIEVNDVEKDIEKTIEEMKKRDEYPWPEKKYKELENKSVSPMTAISENHLRRDRNEKLVISLLTILCCFFIILSSVLFISYNSDNKIIPKGNNKTTISQGSQMVHDIKFTINNTKREPNTLTADISVSNKSKNNFYVTVSGMSLVDENGKVYYPNLYKGKIPENFFGEKILPNTSHSAEILFDGVPATSKKLTIVANNVSDIYHFTWDYMITLP